MRVKCGCISASLAKSASPTSYTTAGTTITYTYTITNTGSVPLCFPIQICDDKLGTKMIPCSSIIQGGSQAFTSTYVTTAADLLLPFITNTATAYLRVNRCDWVATNSSSTTVINDSIFLTNESLDSRRDTRLAPKQVKQVPIVPKEIRWREEPIEDHRYLGFYITQTSTDQLKSVLVFTILNEGAPIQNVEVLFAFPNNVTECKARSNCMVGANTVKATIPDLKNSFEGSFEYSVSSHGDYTWTGKLKIDGKEELEKSNEIRL